MRRRGQRRSHTGCWRRAPPATVTPLPTCAPARPGVRQRGCGVTAAGSAAGLGCAGAAGVRRRGWGATARLGCAGADGVRQRGWGATARSAPTAHWLLGGAHLLQPSHPSPTCAPARPGVRQRGWGATARSAPTAHWLLGGAPPATVTPLPTCAPARPGVRQRGWGVTAAGPAAGLGCDSAAGVRQRGWGKRDQRGWGAPARLGCAGAAGVRRRGWGAPARLGCAGAAGVRQRGWGCDSAAGVRQRGRCDTERSSAARGPWPPTCSRRREPDPTTDMGEAAAGVLDEHGDQLPPAGRSTALCALSQTVVAHNHAVRTRSPACDRPRRGHGLHHPHRRPRVGRHAGVGLHDPRAGPRARWRTDGDRLHLRRAGRACRSSAGTLAGVVQGRDATAPAASWAAMQHAVRNLGRPGLVAEAISAVDVALWDLHARLLDVPLTVALGAVHDATPIYGSGGFTSYDDRRLREQLGGWVAGGNPAGQDEGRPPPGGRRSSRVRAARQAIGDGSSCSSTPTARTPASRRSGGPSGSPSSTSAGSRSPSPPTTSPACGCCATAGPAAWTSPRGSTAMTWPTSTTCSPPRPSTACRPTSPAAAASGAAARRGAVRRPRHRPLAALRAAGVRARRHGRLAPATPGVLPRPRAHRGHGVRRRARPGAGRRCCVRTGIGPASASRSGPATWSATGLREAAAGSPAVTAAGQAAARPARLGGQRPGEMSPTRR